METITEYWLRPLDENGDPEDVFFSDSINEAYDDRVQFADMYPNAKWELEEVVMVYDTDGNLKETEYKLLNGDLDI